MKPPLQAKISQEHFYKKIKIVQGLFVTEEIVFDSCLCLAAFPRYSNMFMN